MDDQTMYRVCPHRNVPAAFERFLGGDSGGLDRFFASSVEREFFFGHYWQYRYAVIASGWREYAELAASAAEVFAALQPLASAAARGARRVLTPEIELSWQIDP